MNGLKANFKNDKKVQAGGTACVACGLEEESNSHVMACSKCGDLRMGKDFSVDDDLVTYFRDVMARRETIEKGN